MRPGPTASGATELRGGTEPARAMSATAGALLLESLDGPSPLIPPLEPGAAAPETRERLDDIARWSKTALGRPDPPLLWRILAHNPHYLDATWRKEGLVMAGSALAARDKRRTALGVAMAAGARYMIEYHAAILRRAGDTDGDLLEVLGVVDHYTTLNTLSEGMQIESDIRP